MAPPSFSARSPTGAGRPGRPRSFDPALALASALEVLLDRGCAVSLNELTEAMGISRPSFYVAFGSKEALFMAALDLHARRHRALLDQALAEPTAEALAARLLRNALAYPDLAGGIGGFMGFLSSLPAGTAGQSLRGAIMAHRQQVIEALTERFIAAHRIGEIRPDLNPRMLSCLLEALAHGIAANRLAGMTPADAEDLLQHTLAMMEAMLRAL